MRSGNRGRLIRVKRGLLHHPVVVGVGSALLLVLLTANIGAFLRGLDSPWLLGAVIVADMVVIGVGVLVAAREVLTAEAGTVAAEEQLAAIVEWSDDAIVSKSLDGVIHSWNRGAERTFGYAAEEAVGQPIITLIIPEERRDEEERVMARIRRGEPVPHFETVRRTKDGRLIDISLSVSPIRDAGGRVIGASKIARDITQSKQMQAALNSAQARLAAIVDSAMDAVITVDQQQNIVLFNRAAEKVFGVRPEEAIGTPLDRFIPARFRGAHRHHVAHFGATGITSRRMGDVTTLWGVHAGGAEFPIEASISQAAEGGQRFYTVILRDITLRKRHEDDLRRSQQELRELSARVLEAREEEKARIARELHDELGQLLTALKMDLSWLRERLDGAADLAQKASEMGALLDQTVTATRRISADLRPLMLDDLGLADAAQWLVDDFAKRTGIQASIDLPQTDAFERLSKPVQTALYRAVQESLTNIARHAGAKRAWVVFLQEDGVMRVEVEDDGRGIALEDLAKVGSLGLKGMRERIAYLGGSLDIGRAPRGGTRLRVKVPLQ